MLKEPPGISLKMMLLGNAGSWPTQIDGKIIPLNTDTTIDSKFRFLITTVEIISF